jgi:hypothetical protein
MGWAVETFGSLALPVHTWNMDGWRTNYDDDAHGIRWEISYVFFCDFLIFQVEALRRKMADTLL